MCAIWFSCIFYPSVCFSLGLFFSSVSVLLPPVFSSCAAWSEQIFSALELCFLTSLLPTRCHHICHCCLACYFQVKIFKLGDLCGEKMRCSRQASCAFPLLMRGNIWRLSFSLPDFFEDSFPQLSTTRFTSQNNTFTLNCLWALIEVPWLTD